MAFKVLVVDDSAFYRRSLKKILEADRLLTVIGEASNGKEAIELIHSLSPDVVTMDVEMPVMDGISAVKRIMSECPVPILMFSSLTYDGATATLDALDAGALDFLPKKFEDISENKQDALLQLRTKVRIVARRKAYMRANKTDRILPTSTNFMRSSSVLTGQSNVAEQVSVSSVSASGKSYQCLAIGSSTGGPVALQTILTKLPASFPLPILIVQHMPGSFTEAFSERLNSLCSIDVLHAQSGMKLEAGKAYIAPGGMQTQVNGYGENATLTVRDTLVSESVNYKPCVDVSFESLVNVFSGNVLALILTGMGSDGKMGCEKLKAVGATVWAQDQSSSVVYGMPQAVASAGISEKSIGLDHIADCLLSEVVRK